jgi:hypothetical protein
MGRFNGVCCSFAVCPNRLCKAKEKRVKGITGSTRCACPIMIDRQEEGFPPHDLMWQSVETMHVEEHDVRPIAFRKRHHSCAEQVLGA